MRIYFYKLTADSGGAPCVKDGWLSLAICKPMIRRTGKPGDLVFGFAANSLHRDNRLIYIAQIIRNVRNGDYYRERQFASRTDRIYQCRRSRFSWRQGALHHGPKHLVHDLGRPPEYERANVLLSTDFRYFGAKGTAEYKSRFPHVKDAVEQLGRGHRVTHAEQLRTELLSLKQRIWKTTSKRIVGKPTSKPRRDVCHRSRSCGVLA